MNWTASHLANRKELQRLVQMEGFCRQRADYHIFLWGMESAYVADYLIGADQKIPNGLVKATFLREVVTVVRLGIKPWAGGMDLAQEIPFVAYCLFFFFLSEIYEYYCCCYCCQVASVVSDSVRPHGLQPTRLSVHGILQARTLEWVAISFSNAWKWKVKDVAQSCPTLSDPMDCSLPGSSIHGIFRATVVEWGAIASSYEYYYCLLILCFMPRHQVNGKSLIVALGMHYSFRIQFIIWFFPPNPLLKLSLKDKW